MDWDDLRFYLAVAEAGSLNAAAQRLGVNHSTVFRRINRFERSVGARLFERLPDGYQLTQAGEDLLDHARRVGDEIDALQLKVLGQDFRPGGKIRITAPDNLAYDYLPEYLKVFCALYPDIRLELSVGAETLDLTRREADLAVRATLNPPGHLVGRKVCGVKWAWYASMDYLNEAGAPKSQAQLAGHPLIGADGALARIGPLRRMLIDLPTSIVMSCSTLNGMAAMAEAGFGITPLPDDQNKDTLVRLFTCRPTFASEIWLLTHAELRRTERIRLLMDHLFRSFRADARIRGLAEF